MTLTPAIKALTPTEPSENTQIETIRIKLNHAVTEYDRKQQQRRDYNMFAIAHYLSTVQAAIEAMYKGDHPRKAILAYFNDRLLDVCLKAIK